MPLYGHLEFHSSLTDHEVLPTLDTRESIAFEDTGTEPPTLLLAINSNDRKGSEIYRLPLDQVTLLEKEEGFTMLCDATLLDARYRLSLLRMGMVQRFAIKDADGVDCTVVFQHITAPELN